MLEEYEGAGDYLRVIATESGLMSPSPLNVQRRESRRESAIASSSAIRDKSRDFENLLKMVSDRGSSLRQRNDSPISVVEWISLYDEEGKLMRGKIDLMNMVFSRSVENDIRPEIWKVWVIVLISSFY